MAASINTPASVPALAFQTEEKVEHWLAMSLVGRVREAETAHLLQENLILGGLSTIKVHHLGDDLVLLLGAEGTDLREHLQGNSSWVESLFVSLEPWSKDGVPISLVGCIYKIVTKILVKRLKRVLPNLISKEQSGFLEGRSMLDNILVANELVHDAKYKRKETMIFKVDFKKAYDSVCWAFLTYMMKRVNFNSHWIAWIEGCLRSASVSVLVNGSPCQEFVMERDLRQGIQWLLSIS